MADSTHELNDVLKQLSESGDYASSTVLTEESKTGVKIPSSHLAKIQKWTREDIDKELIHTFPVIMIDTEPTRNLVVYTEASQKKSLKGWIGRTVLFNWNGSGNVGIIGQADHSLQAASQTARIYDARMVRTPSGAVGTLGWFYAVEGVDVIIDSFIKKLNAGVLREVSIHVAVPEGVVCSIDGKSFSGYEGGAHTEEEEKTICFDHQPGNKYGREVCYMSTGEGRLDPLELSAVAVPGSINAHVLKDDEVENYKIVSLKEALGGSNHLKEIIMAKKTKTVAALEEIANIAKNAGFLQEAKEDPADGDCGKCGHASHEGACSKNCGSCSKDETADPKTAKPGTKTKDEESKDDEEESKSEEEENGKDTPGNDRKDLKVKKGEAVSPKTSKPGTKTKDEEKNEEEEEAADPKSKKPSTTTKDEEKNEEEERMDDPDDKKEEDEEKESDPPEGDDDSKKSKKASKQSFLFDDNCPACGGNKETVQPLSESETISLMRDTFKEQVEIIIKVAKEKIATAKQAAVRAEQFDEIFDLFVQETATMAVNSGLKKFQERDNYIVTLKALSFNAVREIRETLSLKDSAREDKVEVIRQSMMERSKQNLGTIIEDDNGKKKSSNGVSARPKFGLR
jgi:hypothetical protein